MRRPSTVLVLAVAFFAAVAGTCLFAVRAGRHARLLRWENEPIRPWMSVPFIAHTHHVPAAILFQALGLPPHPHDRRPLRLIAREEHKPIDEVIRDLDHALTAAGHVHSPPGSPRDHP
ncbi:MAG: hypothetical protein ABSH50_23875 [Bryobacteraceae bacterium]